MKMRQQFPITVGELTDSDERVVTLLGDIGVWSFHKVKEAHPDRVYNIGILEQATISAAAGMAKTGLIPVVHTITPFIIERAYEQLKLDFGYQKLGGNFVSVGGSYDYSGLGPTHYCPADILALSLIPNMQIFIPGTAEEFDRLFKKTYDNGLPSYFRISNDENINSYPVEPGKMIEIKKGSKATVIAVGPYLQRAIAATEGLNVTLLYCTSVCPFDYDTLAKYYYTNKVIFLEPYYSGALAKTVTEHIDLPMRIFNIGIRKEFVTNYGKVSELDDYYGLTEEKIRQRIESILSI